MVELPASVEDGHDDLDGGSAVEFGVFVLHGSDWDSDAIVCDTERTICEHADVAGGCAAGHDLIDGIVDGFPDEVMQGGLIGSADVHAGALPDGAEALEDLDIAFVVIVLALFASGALDGGLGFFVGRRIKLFR